MNEPAPQTCRHCQRRIVNEDGRWVDPEATGDDSVWRETCDANDTFTAEHEPAMPTAEAGLPTPTLNDFKAVRSDDSVKTDLELTCLVCGEHLCDIEPDDILAILVAVAEDHIKESHSG